MSSSSSVKQAHRATRYNPLLARLTAASAAGQTPADGEVTEEPPADWAALLSLALGVGGLMMRYKLCAWLALFTCLSSVMTMRRRDMDFKQVACSLLFAIMGLVMNYFGPAGNRAGAAGGASVL